MTTPKINTIKRGGSRLYVEPTTGEKVPGVTSVLNMLPKEFLKFWAAKVVAETAVDHAGSWINMALNGERQGAVDFLKRAPMRDTGQAAQRGTEAHDIMEKLSLGEKVGRVAPDMQWAVDNFRAFVEAFDPEFVELEATVWNDAPAYAGSFDALARIDGELVIIDNKTTRSGVHAEVALQLNAYAFADRIVRPDGSTEPMPEVASAAVFHTTPEGWGLYPVALDRELLMPVFAALHKVMDWDKTISKAVIGNPMKELG